MKYGTPKTDKGWGLGCGWSLFFITSSGNGRRGPIIVPRGPKGPREENGLFNLAKWARAHRGRKGRKLGQSGEIFADKYGERDGEGHCSIILQFNCHIGIYMWLDRFLKFCNENSIREGKKKYRQKFLQRMT